MSWYHANQRFMDLVRLPVLPIEARVQRLPQHEWQALKNQVHAASGGVCFYCSTHTGTYPICDHLLPLSRGGTNAPDNLVTACDACNADKGALTVAEWALKRAAR